MTEALIEVRIRPEEEPHAVRLCDWPVMRLDELIPTINRWGLYCGGLTGDESILSAQFVADEKAAYFEVIVREPEVGR